jgi:hypothetical protein
MLRRRLHNEAVSDSGSRMRAPGRSQARSKAATSPSLILLTCGNVVGQGLRRVVRSVRDEVRATSAARSPLTMTSSAGRLPGLRGQRGWGRPAAEQFRHCGTPGPATQLPVPQVAGQRRTAGPLRCGAVPTSPGPRCMRASRPGPACHLIGLTQLQTAEQIRPTRRIPFVRVCIFQEEGTGRRCAGPH